MGPPHGRQRVRRRQAEPIPELPVRGKDGVLLQGRVGATPGPLLRLAPLMVAIVATKGSALASPEGPVVPEPGRAGEAEPQMEGHKGRGTVGTPPLPFGPRIPSAGPGEARRATRRSIVGPSSLGLRAPVTPPREPGPTPACVLATLGGVQSSSSPTRGAREIGVTTVAAPIEPALSGAAAARVVPVPTSEQEERTATASSVGVGVVPAAVQPKPGLGVMARLTPPEPRRPVAVRTTATASPKNADDWPLIRSHGTLSLYGGGGGSSAVSASRLVVFGT